MDSVPVVVSTRALDILVALVSRANTIVSKRDLMAQVWPEVTVEEGSLRFHIAGLRKALGDGRDGSRYIITLKGRGYCFVAPVVQSRDHLNEAVAPTGFAAASLPAHATGIIGREEDVLRISTLLTAGRFVTIVGSGGIGKTTVAVAVGHHLKAAFAGAVVFVDLSDLSDPRMISTTLASTLGLMVNSDDVMPSLIAYLRDKLVLLILDTCEHLVEEVATVVSRVLMTATQVHILATSREHLQVAGEHVYKLETLGCPPDNSIVSAAVIRAFPATLLFLERATASGARLEVGDAEAAIVASICLKLDGLALAIELAARRVEAYGLQQTAVLLDQRLTLLWTGPRSAPLRQRTLQATLDWSFGLLSETERVVLRRLAIFVGHFTMDGALAVVTNGTFGQADVFEAIDSLVAKSMVATHPVGAMMRYRLLDTTRAYALNLGSNDAELAELAARHASYYRRLLERAGDEWPVLAIGAERAHQMAALANARTALEWCFGPNGSVQLGVGLAKAAAPLFLAMSLLRECRHWIGRTIDALDETTLGSVDEMHLQSALAMSLMFTRGATDAVRAALDRSLSIAEKRGDTIDLLQTLSSMQMLFIRMGNYRNALDCARRSMAAVATTDDADAIALARSMLGLALHTAGELDSARSELETALSTPRSRRTAAISLGFDHHSRSSIILARTLWMQGFPDRAISSAKRTIEDAGRMDNPVTLYVALIWAIPMFLRMQDLDQVDVYREQFLAHAECHSIGPFAAIDRGITGALAIRRGQPEQGVEQLLDCLRLFHAMNYHLLTADLEIELAQGYAALGRPNEGLQLIEETIRWIAENGVFVQMPELLRVKAILSLNTPRRSADDAEVCFLRSLEMSRRQGALTWQVRAATDLARLWIDLNRADSAEALLRPVVDQFTEGLGTADLRSARRLLEALDQAPKVEVQE